MYADYGYYTETYHGSQIEESDWPALSRRADGCIDQLTCGRLRQGWPVTDDVRTAACALAETLYRQDKQAEQGAAGVKSESVGSQSVTYETDQERRQRQAAERLEAVESGLPRWHPLRYAGAYPKGEPPC